VVVMFFGLSFEDIMNISRLFVFCWRIRSFKLALQFGVDV
jgi:hypothetical protein